MSYTRAFARGVEYRRKRLELSLRELSDKSGVSRPSLRRLLWEEGGVTLETASKLATTLSSTIDNLALVGLQEGGSDDD